MCHLSMRVLFFNYEYPPLGGGAANATAYIMKSFAKGVAGSVTVDVVTSSIDNTYHQERVGDAVVVHRLPIGKNASNLHFQSHKDLVVYTVKAYFFARRLCARHHYDVTHAFFSVPCGLIAALLKKHFGLPYVVSLRGSDVPGYSDRFTALYTILRPITRWVWKNAAAVVANSDGLKDLALRTRPEQDIGVIFNGVDTDDFFPDPTKRPKDTLIVTTGATRLTARKGIHFLVEAMQSLSQTHPHVRLKAMGEGDARDDLVALARRAGVADKVEFIGRVPREETTQYYQEASVFVFPSLNEGMGNALLEALACGLPVVVTDVGGTKELVQDGVNGIIVPTSDAAAIAAAVARLADDPATRATMGAQSRAVARQYSWDNIARAYAAVYAKIVDAP